MTRLNAATTHIVKVDPAFRRIVETTLTMEVRPPTGSAFESLLSAIVFQQLAGAAARAIHGRLVTALGGAPVAPEAVLAAKPATHARRGALCEQARRHHRPRREVRRRDGADGRSRRAERRRDRRAPGHRARRRAAGPPRCSCSSSSTVPTCGRWTTSASATAGRASTRWRRRRPRSRSMLLGEILRPYRSTAAWYCWRAVAAVPIVPAAVAATKPPLTAAGRRPPSRPKKA